MQKHQSEAARILGLALKKKKRITKLPRSKPPITVERDYRRAVRPILVALDGHVKRDLLTRLPTLVASFYQSHPNLSYAKTHTDADEADEINRIIGDIKIKIGAEYTADELKQIAARLGLTLSEANEGAILNGISKVASVDVFLAEPWLEGQLEMFAASNAELISGLVGDALDNVRKEVMSGLMNGQRAEDIARDITGYLNPDDSQTSRRAEFIARDQVSKLNGQLTELRQTDLGIKKYIWRTSLDERVRDSHKTKEGKIYEWADPPADTGNPGEDYNCRCTAEPYLEEMLGSGFESTGLKEADVTENSFLGGIAGE